MWVCNLVFQSGESHRLRVFENGGLRRLFGPKRDEIKGKWKRLSNDELHDLHSAPNIIRAIKSRKIRRDMHAARMGERGG